MPREVVEASVFWGGELFAVKYFAFGERVLFDDVPQANGIEVRTRVVEAGSRMPRTGWDLPYGAVALAACFCHALVVASIAVAPQGKPVATSSESRTVTSEPVSGGGSEQPTATPGARFIRGDEGTAPQTVDETDAPLTREEVGAFGMIGLLAEYQGTESSPWVSVPRGASSTMWGDAIGDARGIGGIGLSGVGEGGGGNALGSYVLDRIHTGDGYGVAYGHGRLVAHEHHVKTITCRLTSETVSCTRMAPELIQRVVRANEGKFRACYMDGLKRDPKLAGRVTTKFVIARDGSVAAADDAGSDLGDPAVVSCVQRAFTSLEFPESPSGIATVVYPLVMQPE